jgi:hypothetical protein
VGLRDLLYAVPILGLALWILWRSTVRSGGRCAGCSGGCATPPKGGPGPGLVRLGRSTGRGPGGGG